MVLYVSVKCQMRTSCRIIVTTLHNLICLFQRFSTAESRAVFVINDFQALALDKVILQGISPGHTDFDLTVEPANCTEGCIFDVKF